MTREEQQQAYLLGLKERINKARRFYEKERRRINQSNIDRKIREDIDSCGAKLATSWGFSNLFPQFSWVPFETYWLKYNLTHNRWGWMRTKGQVLGPIILNSLKEANRLRDRLNKEVWT